MFVIIKSEKINKRFFLTAICPICNKEFKADKYALMRPNRLSCSRECKNQFYLDNLKEYAGFKILKVGLLIKGKRAVLVECKVCKNPFETKIQHLLRTTSCGCTIYTVGYNPRLIRIRRNMLSRCYTKSHISYCRYGARGISVCTEWIEPTNHFFEWALANGYKDDLTLDRINNDGNYEPSNCRWATRKDQMMNTRKSKKG